MKTRCGWVTNDPLYLAYHDSEWGVPEHNDRKLFELLIVQFDLVEVRHGMTTSECFSG
jgi:3-methyladenine DNA glycosylase Tag